MSSENMSYLCTFCNHAFFVDELQLHPCFDGKNVIFDGVDVVISEKEISEVAAPVSGAIIWAHDRVLALIDIWKINNSKFGIGSISNKAIWKEIGTKLTTESFNPDWLQVSNKWKGLLRTYKRIKDNNNSTGRGFRRWTYFDAMDEAMNNRPEINPISRASSSKGFSEGNSSRANASPNEQSVSELVTMDEENISPVITRRRMRQQQTLEWVTEMLQGQERRHKENMASREIATNKICGILEKFLEKL